MNNYAFQSKTVMKHRKFNEIISAHRQTHENIVFKELFFGLHACKTTQFKHLTDVITSNVFGGVKELAPLAIEVPQIVLNNAPFGDQAIVK